MVLRNLQTVLGLGTSYQTIVTSSSFVLLCYFYIYSFASYLKLPIIIFQNGYTYTAFFENTYLIDKNWDYLFIIALTVVWVFLSIRTKKLGIAISLIYTGLTMIAGLGGLPFFYDLMVFLALPITVSLLVTNKVVKEKNILKSDTNLLILNYSSIIIIISSVIGIFLSSSFLLFSIQPSSVPIHNYTYPPYVLFSNLAPVLVLLLMFSLFIKILIIKFDLRRILTKFSESRLPLPTVSGITTLPTKINFFYLSIIIILSIILFLIPYNPTINETKQLIGFDTDEYIQWETTLLNTTSFEGLINHAFVLMSAGDRPITLFFLLFVIKITTIDDPSVIVYFPIILLPLFILTVFFLTKELFSNDTTALFAAFLSGASFHLLVGVYAGLYANWLALIVGYIAILLFFKYLKGSNRLFGILFFISLIVLLFTHVYTWGAVSVVLGIFTIYVLIVDNSNRKRTIFLLLGIVISFVLDIVRIYFTDTSSGTQNMVTVVNRGMGLEQFYHSWENLAYSTQVYVGGIFSNFVIYVLGIYWSLRSNIKEPRNVFLFIFLSLSIVPIFIGDEVMKTRFFYDIPFQIPAAIALTYMMQTNPGKMVALSLCMWILFIAVRTAFHLYVILPK